LEFPGNVRQLENIVRQSVVNHGNFGELDLADLPVDVLHQLAGRLELNSAALSRHAEPPALGEQMPSEPMHEFAKRILESQEWNLPRALRECERQVFEVALHRAEGNQSQAARLLGITPRSVYNKIRKHGLPA
jgi:DNA-binding NtrC family response regulator